MADHSEPSPKHSHERPDPFPAAAIPALATNGRDTAVILLASATAVFLAVAVALSLMLWRGNSDDELAAGTASTPDVSAAAQPVAPGPSDQAASAASEPEESAHAAEATAEATESTEESAEATAEATATAHAESTESTESEDPDAATAEDEAAAAHDELPVTGSSAATAIPLLISLGLALTFGGAALTRVTRRRVAAAGAAGEQISAVEALRLLLSEVRPRDELPEARHLSPADQTARLSRVARQASERRGASR